MVFGTLRIFLQLQLINYFKISFQAQGVIKKTNFSNLEKPLPKKVIFDFYCSYNWGSPEISNE